MRNVMTIYLVCRLLDTSSSPPESHNGPDRTAAGRSHACSLFGLAPGGVYLASRVTPTAGALLPHHFTLTCSISSELGTAIGGVLSVALSLTSRSVGVTDHPVLRCPDFPLVACTTSGHPVDSETNRHDRPIEGRW